MPYQFDEKGFMIIPDPRLLKEAKDILSRNKVVVVEYVYCPNGHNLIWDYADFNGYPGIRLKVRKKNQQEGDVVLSPIFGDHTRVSLGVKLTEGEAVNVFCPICGIEIPVLKECDKCKNGRIRVLSLSPKFDITRGIAFCDLVGCPNSYIVKSGELISEAYLEGRA